VLNEKKNVLKLNLQLTRAANKR